MGSQPLPREMRMRVVMVAICAAVLVLLGLPLEVVAVRSSVGVGDLAFVFGIGVALPVAFGALMWWQVRRYRNNPQVRRRQLNDRAARTKLWGNVAVVLMASVAREVAPVTGLNGLLTGLVVALIGAVAVHLVVRRLDPRARFWRRPDPLPEGQEPEVEPAPKPW